MHGWICLHLWRSEAFGIKLEAQWNPPCVRLCANIGFSSCWLFIAKLKVSVTAEDGGWTEIWYLCTQAQSPVSLSHTHKQSQREITSLFPAHAHSPSACQDASKQAPVYWHETTWMLFSDIGDILFYSSAQDNLNIPLAGRHSVFFLFHWGAQKSSHYLPLSAKMQKDTEREERGERGARILLGTLNNSVNQALRKAEQVKIFVCFPQWQFQRDVNTRPLTLKGYNTTHCFFYTHSIAVGEMLYGSTICFALWWILVWNEMHAGRSHDM